MDDDGTIFWVVALCAFIVWSGWDSDGFIRHIRFQVKYGVGYSDVNMRPQPKDCDFWTAPMGRKNCTYVPAVSAYDVSGKIVRPSFPGEKADKLRPVKSIAVSWIKLAS